MRVRYRKLISGDTFWGDVAAGLTALSEHHRDPDPVHVEAQDFEAEDWEVEAKLHKGDLSPTDLVDVGRGWEPLGECLRFVEICEELDRGRRYRPLLFGAAVLAVALGLVLAMFLLLGWRP